MDYFIKLIKRKYKVDISGDKRALQKLRREAERAKRALSSSHQAHLVFSPGALWLMHFTLHLVTLLIQVQVRVEIESLADGVDLSEPLTRARFEELNNDLFKKTLTPVKKV